MLPLPRPRRSCIHKRLLRFKPGAQHLVGKQPAQNKSGECINE